MKAELAPLILFCFDRPGHVQEVLENIARNELASETRLIIYADGLPENHSKEQAEKVFRTREIIHKRPWCGTVEIYESDKNKGLARSVINGMNETLALYGKAIVLEDDLVPSPYFLRFMNEALDKYEKIDEVISVAAYVYPVKGELPENFFLKGADCWGWATWKRGWSLFREDAFQLLHELNEKKLNHDFDFDDTYPYTNMLREQVEGKINSWAIRWYASAYLAGKYTLYPGKSLIQNTGIDGSGTHSGRSEKWNVRLAEHPLAVKDIIVKESLVAREAFKRYFKSLKAKPGLFKRLFRKLSGGFL